jgi:ParB-like chromosome segregation protein Spo0J
MKKTPWYQSSLPKISERNQSLMKEKFYKKPKFSTLVIPIADLKENNDFTPSICFHSPVYDVRAIPIQKLRANEYNPNRVAPPEMQLLYDSIKVDGYTMPIVVYYHQQDDVYEIVDGFHRYTVMLLYPDIYEREKGMLPCSVIEKPISERMASTVRHNRARGSHNVDLMSNIVAELTEMGKSDKWISEHLGMSPDEILRLKQITGLADLFKDREFSKSWEV